MKVTFLLYFTPIISFLFIDISRSWNRRCSCRQFRYLISFKHFPPCGLGPFHCTWYMSPVFCKLPYGVYIFEVSLGCWDVFFNLLKIRANFHFLHDLELIKIQDVSVIPLFLSTLSICDSFNVCHTMFSQGCCNLVRCCQGQLSTSDNSFTLFTNPSARARYDTRSIFKRSLTGLSSEFSFS